ncbi:MAG: hypothetical protein M1438_06890 [Deltaproteobacteria bacterium]|nr:hypothetical protein [Deltaproteobacteria bacterium]
MKNIYLAIFATLAAFCLLAMLTVTAIWMYVPIRIVYQESSPIKTATYSVEVIEHSHAYFLTAGQKRVIDLIRSYTPIVWFSCFGYLVLFTAFGGFQRLRLLQRHNM